MSAVEDAVDVLRDSGVSGERFTRLRRWLEQMARDGWEDRFLLTAARRWVRSSP